MFPAKRDGEPGIRIWNSQLIRFAGYLQDDGSVIGDPGNVRLTQEAIRLYWRHLRADGILALHVSNRYLNLQPV